jgi:hypothetical protein
MGKAFAQLPLIERKEKLARLFKKEIGGLRYSEHVRVMAPASASTPASSAWKVLSRSSLIAPKLQATAGSGSSRSA